MLRTQYLVTSVFKFKYSMENENKSLFCGALFSLCGILEVCEIDMVGYILFEIPTYLIVCENSLTRHISPLTSATSDAIFGHVHEARVISRQKQPTKRQVLKYE